MLDAALAGARAVMAVYATDFAVQLKADDSPVSEADRQAEAAILTRLAAAVPDIPVVAEEAVSDGKVPQIGARFFLVDPLDGTKEFISRNGEFTVNIGLIEDGVPTAGIVLAPALGHAYAGGAAGAWAGRLGEAAGSVETWRPIRCRRAGAAPVAVASRSHSNPATEDVLARAKAGDRRSIGSSLKFCLVAEAAADFYPRLGPTMEWDTAAGDAVLRAAGGIVVTLDRAPLPYGKTGVAGMREFENPHFFAAGDPAILACLDPTKAA
jgi:3'(2'),5'-bisphosphate nucleotidase